MYQKIYKDYADFVWFILEKNWTFKNNKLRYYKSVLLCLPKL